MKSIVINRQSIMLSCAALLLNVLFLIGNDQNTYYLGMLYAHGEVAYNVAHYNAVTVNKERMSLMARLSQEKGRRVEYAEIDPALFGPTNEYRSIQDTIGYGVVLGLLWKLTGSHSYRDIQFLQIILFSLTMVLLYSMAFMLCGSWYAWLTGISLLFFLPITYLNVQAMRDIWAFYGIALLLWMATALIKKGWSWPSMVIGSSLFALCQWVRPTIFASLVAVSGVLFVVALLKHLRWSSVVSFYGLIFLCNLLIFWLPFMAYNQRAYGRFFVMPSGQGLLEGMGEFPNKWGFCLSDDWISGYVEHVSGYRYGTPEFDDAAKVLFNQAYREDPWHFYASVMQRIPLLVLPGLPWNNISNVIDHTVYSSLLDKVRAKAQTFFSSWKSMADFFGRQIYVRLLMLMGYLGLFLALINGHWFLAALVLLGGIAPGANCIYSHIEYRFLVPFFAFHSFFIGYFVWSLKRRSKQ